ncbi:MAG: flagellar type III secretion system pore protein FliP [Clostridiales bacterium]|jgi:flagellar biosynthetic protein FliP|nr:flagellar type III secretion system pore protein FliP [Clostridiales bacterium]
MNNILKINRMIVLLIIFFILTGGEAFAGEITVPPVPDIPSIEFNFNNGASQNGDSMVQLLILLTVIALAPSILIMMTSFTRIIIALHFLRSALGTQQMPPNQVLIGLALILTMFVMGPVFSEINEAAFEPYSKGEITQETALELGMGPIRKFMFAQTDEKDMALFLELSGEVYQAIDDIPSSVLIPAFILGELTKGFIFGVIVYIPFIVVDMVVASVLMAMGMMMLPPAMISMPFKILIFVLAGGFNIVIENLVKTFKMVL